MTGEPSALDVWSDLPRVDRRTLALERVASAWLGPGPLGSLFGWLGALPGLDIALDRPEVDLRAAGIARPGLVAQLRLPRHGARLALGVEVPVAHAVVDHLLGFDRPFAERRLQLTPVEWGVWTYLVVRSLEEMRPNPGFSVDRVGPDPFDASGLGPITTIRWAVRVGETAGAVRLWLPESLAEAWLGAEPPPRTPKPHSPKLRELAADWRVVAGRVTTPRGGLGALRPGGVLPLTDPPLTGEPNAPVGPLFLVHRTDDGGERRIAVTVDPGSTRGAVVVSGPLVHEPSPDPGSQPAMPSDADAPLDAPVTLTVELGRINLPVSRLADLKPGDVLPLNRHGREPVELTSNGRAVARGELILIDEELGLRVTNVFL